MFSEDLQGKYFLYFFILKFYYRRFYEFMSRVATNEDEKAKIRHLLTKEGK